MLSLDPLVGRNPQSAFSSRRPRSAFLCEFLPLLEATIACLVPDVPQGTNHADSYVS
jgi:hypothetical protein